MELLLLNAERLENIHKDKLRNIEYRIVATHTKRRCQFFTKERKERGVERRETGRKG